MRWIARRLALLAPVLFVVRSAQAIRALGPSRERTVKPLGAAGSAKSDGRWRRPRSRSLGSKPARPPARVEARRRTATPRRKRTRSSLARDPGTAAAPSAREGERSRTSASARHPSRSNDRHDYVRCAQVTFRSEDTRSLGAGRPLRTGRPLRNCPQPLSARPTMSSKRLERMVAVSIRGRRRS